MPNACYGENLIIKYEADIKRFNPDKSLSLSQDELQASVTILV